MADTRHRAEELLHSVQDVIGNLRANHLWERVRTSDPVVALWDYRDELERRVEQSVTRVLGSLQIVTRSDLESLEQELTSLRRRVDKLSRQHRN
jgi:polyhydroxyalkanoate synthesis regulator phasin